MFTVVVVKHVFLFGLFLGVTSHPAIQLALKVSSAAQVFYNSVQIPTILMPSITVNITQVGTGQPAPQAPTTPRPPVIPAPPTTFRPTVPPITARPLTPPTTPRPGVPIAQPQTVSISLSQPQVVSTDCLGIGCYSLLPLVPVQPVVYTQPIYYSWGWRHWAFGWSSCYWYC